ncbi:hypothetical protein BV349_05500 [Pseudomonas syringae pv. actinidiae]|nr:hypothetical protein BV349_05500 [Pseudomonas syringae pv. actinidiae]OSN66025.1 hypothetical protein BV351_05531 [Pseudomonas syringae pv. actinidiae]
MTILPKRMTTRTFSAVLNKLLSRAVRISMRGVVIPFLARLETVTSPVLTSGDVAGTAFFKVVVASTV